MQTYSPDQEVLQTAYLWLKDGHEVVLVTVLKTWGSSPRPAGSMMIMRQDNVLCGSVSGGCVEEDLLQRYVNNELGDNCPTLVDYGVNREDATRFGMPCGGRLELLVEKLNNQLQLQKILEALKQQQLLTRRVDLQTGKVSLGEASSEQNFIYTNAYVCKVFGPQWSMLLIGAGHLSQYVSKIGLMLGYRIIVCDPREEYSSSWQIDGTELTTMMPDDAVQHYSRHMRSIVIALTHDPKLDDMALLDALQTPAFYVGAIGSQRNCESRRKRLKQMGISSSQLQRLHAPVGLAIGSHAPPEIAISIMAEITQLRNKQGNEQNSSLKQSVSLA